MMNTDVAMAHAYQKNSNVTVKFNVVTVTMNTIVVSIILSGFQMHKNTSTFEDKFQTKQKNV